MFLAKIRLVGKANIFNESGCILASIRFLNLRSISFKKSSTIFLFSKVMVKKLNLLYSFLLVEMSIPPLEVAPMTTAEDPKTTLLKICSSSKVGGSLMDVQHSFEKSTSGKNVPTIC